MTRVKRVGKEESLKLCFRSATMTRINRVRREESMDLDLMFVLNSALLGAGLAMDAFSVSAANGLHEPGMPRRKTFLIAGTFAFFQFLMPMLGWFCVHTFVQYFNAFDKFVPWIALILLLYIGSKMLMEGIRGEESDGTKDHRLSGRDLVIQGIATSIDALSVGFTIADYDPAMAFICSLIVAAVTLIICLGGIRIGKTLGNRLSGKASVLGGIILIGIGLEIFIKGVFL